VATSLIVFLLLYGALAVVDAILMIRYSRKAIEPPPTSDDEGVEEEQLAAMSY
jgi:cytochrome bd-type quinol oxidase subunit 1